MKKLLLILISILILILTGITVTRGINVSNISILGIKDIKEKNDNLDVMLQRATKLVSTDYQNAQLELNSKIKKLQNKKQELEEKQNTISENYLNGITPSGLPYQIDYLWVTVGNYAKAENITMEMNSIKNGKEYIGNEKKIEEKDKIYYYDINFTITGTYVNISEFLIDIEDDSSLAFKIEEFNMMASEEIGNIVQANFKCKDIPIKGVSNNSITSTDTNNIDNSINTTNSTEKGTKNNVNTTNSSSTANTVQ